MPPATTLVLTLAATLTSPTPVAPPDFEPVTAEITVDEDGTLEILAFDERGAMIGALLATPTEDHVQIDASFTDGYASMAMVLNPAVPFVQSFRTDLPDAVAGERVAALLSLGSPRRAGPRPSFQGPSWPHWRLHRDAVRV